MRRTSLFLCGIFLTLASAGCGSAFVPGVDYECSEPNNVFCPESNQACVDNVCVTLCTNDLGCEAHQECGPHRYCIDRVVDKCSEFEPCEDGFFCDADETCQKEYNVGHVCDAASPEQCASGLCVDGVCCLSECSGECEACSADFTGETDGTCAPAAAGTDPDAECEGLRACDGAGACFAKAIGVSCTADHECLSQICHSGECVENFCGDGVPDPSDEECDLGSAANNGAYDGCNNNCTLAPFCGDANVDPIDASSSEVCDDGKNDNTYGSCGTDCLSRAAHCGDDIVQGDHQEECDKGQDNADGVYNGCNEDCSHGPFCGDGTTDDAHGEVCDDGSNQGAYGGCNPGCGSRAAHCGDDEVNGLEECDPPSAATNCGGDCLWGYTCGDGVTDVGEDCDDGNTTDDGNGCSMACNKNSVCGNGQVETYFEACDDNNTSPGEGCSATCQIEQAWKCSGEPSDCIRIIFVDVDASGGDTGLSWVDAYTDLQAALTEAASVTAQAEIWVSTGVYNPGSLPTDSFELQNNLGLYGGFAGTEENRIERNPAANVTTLHGYFHNHQVATGSNLGNTAILDGFTIAGGYSGYSPSNLFGQGGGIYLADVSGPRLSNLVVTENKALSGGGIHIDGSAQLESVEVSGNLANFGGGIYAINGALLISDSVIEGNSANGQAGSFGGGLVLGAPNQAIVRRTAIISNSAYREAGGAYVSGGSVSFVSCEFVSNAVTYYSAQTGFGLVATGQAVVKIHNSVVAAHSGGGAQFYSKGTIFSDNSTLELSFTTVGGNDLGLQGNQMSYWSSAGVFLENGGLLTVRNSVLDQNTVNGCCGIGCGCFDTSVLDIVNPDGLATIHISDTRAITSATGSNVITQPARFVDSPNDMRLGPGSPCIDTAEFNPPDDVADLDNDENVVEDLPLDLDGTARVKGPDGADMGAYEK